MRVDDLSVSVPTLVTLWRCCSLASCQATNEGKGFLPASSVLIFSGLFPPPGRLYDVFK